MTAKRIGRNVVRVEEGYIRNFLELCKLKVLSVSQVQYSIPSVTTHFLVCLDAEDGVIDLTLEEWGKSNG